MTTHYCERCKRPIDQESDNFVEWEAIDEDGDKVVCPGCLTGAEEQAVIDDVPTIP